MLMLLSLKNQRFQTLEKKNLYFRKLVNFKSYTLDGLSLKKKKSLLEFQLASNKLKDQQFYIIENNIKSEDVKHLKEVTSRKLVKSGILLSDNILFKEKKKMKYFLRLFIFSNVKSLNKYCLTISNQENSLPSFLKINFLVFKKLHCFLLYLINFEKIYIKFNVYLKLIR